MLFRFAAVIAAALAAAPRVLAQGCAMCYTLAQAQDSRAARHLDYAIIALLVPSVSLFAGVFIAAMRRSYSDQADQPRDRDLPPGETFTDREDLNLPAGLSGGMVSSRAANRFPSK